MIIVCVVANLPTKLARSIIKHLHSQKWCYSCKYVFLWWSNKTCSGDQEVLSLVTDYLKQCWLFINEVLLLTTEDKFIGKVHIMACCLIGAKPFTKPMLTLAMAMYSPILICSCSLSTGIFSPVIGDTNSLSGAGVFSTVFGAVRENKVHVFQPLWYYMALNHCNYPNRGPL